MIPFLHHEARSSKWPFATVCLVGLNIIAFVFELSMGPRFYPLLQEWGLVPARVNAEVSLHNILTIITSMFLHVGWFHLIGNMVFLLVFGEAVEGALGWRWFLFLYFMAGFFGDVGFMLVSSDLAVPAIGASGAIAGVMGASLVIWPTGRLHVYAPLWALYLLLVCTSFMGPVAAAVGIPASWVKYGVGGPLGIVLTLASVLVTKRGIRFAGALIRMATVPAWIVLAVFLVSNLMYETLALISPDLATSVGWVAHFGGFAVGAILAWIFPNHAVALEKRALLG